MTRSRSWSVAGLAALALVLAAACAPAAPTPTAVAPKPAPKVDAKPAESPAAKPAGKPAASPAAKPAAVAKPTPNPAARKGGTLVFATSKDIVNPNPVINTQSVGQYIKESMYETLLAYDLDGKLHPSLAESWDISPDARQFTLKLRRGVKFHNGQELKADDVVWITRHIMDPANAAIGNTYVTEVDRVERVDDYTVRFTTKKGSVPFLSNMARLGVVPIIPANSLQPGQIEVGQRPPPGTGPFKFASYQPNNETVVERFDDYWDGAPYLDKVIFKLLPDDSVRFTALRAGDVQIAERVPVEQAPRVERGELRGIRLHQAKNSGSRSLTFNMHSPIFKDKRMREAVHLALDRDQVLAEVWAGYGTPIDILMPPSSVWHKEAQTVIPPRKTDVARAKELMQQAGYQGQDINLMGRRGHDRLAESVQRLLSQAGLNAKVEILETAIHEERQAQGQFDMVISGGSMDDDPVVSLKADFYCEQHRRVDNEAGYCNPTMDRLFDDLETEAGDQKRMEIYKRLVKMISDDFIWVYLGTEPRFFGMVEKVQDFTPTDGGSYLSRFEGLKRTWLAN